MRATQKLGEIFLAVSKMAPNNLTKPTNILHIPFRVCATPDHPQLLDYTRQLLEGFNLDFVINATHYETLTQNANGTWLGAQGAMQRGECDLMTEDKYRNTIDFWVKIWRGLSLRLFVDSPTNLVFDRVALRVVCIHKSDRLRSSRHDFRGRC